MSDSINEVRLLGNLGADVETKDFNGRTKASLRIATSESWTDKSGQKQEKTEWHRLEWWAPPAGILPYLLKGKKVYVSGRIETDTYEKDGVKQYATKIAVDRLKLFSDGKPKDGPRNAPPTGMDEIPF